MDRIDHPAPTTAPGPDATNLTQPDEALRRAQTTESTVSTRALLTRIADRLTGNLPDKEMREVNRLAYAHQYATHEYGYGTPKARAVEKVLLRRMPWVEGRSITRGEYALLLRAVAGRESGQPVLAPSTATTPDELFNGLALGTAQAPVTEAGDIRG